MVVKKDGVVDVVDEDGVGDADEKLALGPAAPLDFEDLKRRLSGSLFNRCLDHEVVAAGQRHYDAMQDLAHFMLGTCHGILANVLDDDDGLEEPDVGA